MRYPEVPRLQQINREAMEVFFQRMCCALFSCANTKAQIAVIHVHFSVSLTGCVNLTYMSMSKTFIGGAVCREFELEMPAAEEMLDHRRVQQGRYCEISATLRYNFSFDGYLHLSRLRNYGGGRVHISLFWVQILSKKWQRRK